MRGGEDGVESARGEEKRGARPAWCGHCPLQACLPEGPQQQGLCTTWWGRVRHWWGAGRGNKQDKAEMK